MEQKQAPLNLPNGLPPMGSSAALLMRGAGTRADGVETSGRDSVWHDDIYHRLISLSWPRFFAAFGAAFLGLNLLFALLYMLDAQGLSSDPHMPWMGSFTRAFFFSIHTIATVGYGNIVPLSLYANIIVTIETACGILLIALVTGIAFARFARPTTRLLFSHIMIVRKFMGVPTLMFRLANIRTNIIYEAQVRVTLLRWEQDGEGWIRRFYDLDLVRHSTPVFFLTWLVMHKIDESSPLFGLTQEEMRVQQDEFIILFKGEDSTTAQLLHGRHFYTANDMRFGQKFVDVLSVNATGQRKLDFSRFHECEPESV